MLGGYFSGRTSENLGYAKFVLHTAVYAYTSEDIGPATVAPPFGCTPIRGVAYSLSV